MNKLIINKEQEDLLTIEQYIHIMNNREFATVPINDFGLMADRSFFGEYVNTENNKFRIFPNASFNPLIYRGENKKYNNFSPGFLRIDENSIKHVIEWTKRIEFIELIKTSPFITFLSSGMNFSVLGYHFDIDNDILYKLNNDGYEVTNRKITWSQHDISFMNYEISNGLIPWLENNIAYRGTRKT